METAPIPSRLLLKFRVDTVLVVVSVGCLVATVAFVAVLQQGSLDGDLGEWLVACFAPGFLVSGWWLVRRRPGLVLGWLFLCAGASVAIAGLGAAYAGAAAVEGWAGVDWGLWIFSWMWQPHAALISIAVLFIVAQFAGIGTPTLVAIGVSVALLVSLLVLSAIYVSTRRAVRLSR